MTEIETLQKSDMGKSSRLENTCDKVSFLIKFQALGLQL